jgi:hypothetical protein
MKADKLSGKKRKKGGGMLDLDQAIVIARRWDEHVDHFTEFENGFHFIMNNELFSINDPGFAISKKDGRIYPGYSAHEFLKGEILSEGDLEV